MWIVLNLVKRRLEVATQHPLFKKSSKIPGRESRSWNRYLFLLMIMSRMTLFFQLLHAQSIAHSAQIEGMSRELDKLKCERIEPSAILKSIPFNDQTVNLSSEECIIQRIEKLKEVCNAHT
jgi:hypothetical protein